MKEIIETVSNFGSAEWVGVGLVGLIVLMSLPFILWRVIVGTPKFVWAASKICAIALIGGGALFAGMSFMKWAHDSKPRLDELKEKHGERGGIRAFWSETLPSLPEEYKIGN